MSPLRPHAHHEEMTPRASSNSRDERQERRVKRELGKITPAQLLDGSGIRFRSREVNE